MKKPFLLYFSEKHFKMGAVDLKTYMSTPYDHCDRLQRPADDEYFSQQLDCYGASGEFFQLGIDRPPPAMPNRNRLRTSLLLHFVISGKGTLDGVPFGRGQCFYNQKRVPFSMNVDPEDPWLLVWINIRNLPAEKLSVTLDEMAENHFIPISDPDGLFKLVQFWMYEMSYSSVSFDFYNGMIDQLCSFLTPKTSPQIPQNPVSKHLLQVVHQSIQYIENNLSTVTVADLVKYSDFEQSYFTRIFTAVKGISPKDYILNAKMEMAKHYLSMTDHSIGEIGTLLGYTHRNSLPALFKSKYGISPQEYRAKNHHNNK